jgi:hypothetical protein
MPAIVTSAGLLILASPLSAEQGGTLVPGGRVRLTWATARGARLTGTVQHADNNVLTIMTDDRGVVKIPRAQVTKVEIPWGRRGHARKGFLTGALAGAMMGALLMAGDSEPLFCFGIGCGPPTTREKVAFVGFTTLASGGIGAGIGALIRSDRWVEVALGRVQVSLGPTRGRGVGVDASFAF